jgi:hypothetical protein
MKTKLSRLKAHSWQTFSYRIEKMLASLINDLYLLVSVIFAKWIMKRELKRREAQQAEVGYEGRKCKLFVALRRKISEKQSNR